MMTPFDLIAIDLDGTLLNPAGVLTDGNRAALHRAHEAGLKVVLCTGRSYTETRPVIESIGLDLDATVTVGGALISDARSGRTLHRTEISDALADETVAWLRDLGYTVMTLIDADAFGFDGFVLPGARRHAAIDLWLAKAPVRMRESAQNRPDGALPLRITVVDETAALESLSPRFQAAFAQRLTHNIIEVRSYGFTVIESFAAPVDKWFGITQLCDRWGIDPRRTVAVGDDVNDIPMLQSAGLGVAMGNAVEAARAAAQRQTARNDEDGVAQLIRELLG